MTIQDFIYTKENVISQQDCNVVIEHFCKLEECGIVRTRQQEANGVAKISKDDKFAFLNDSVVMAKMGGLQTIIGITDALWRCVQEYITEYDSLQFSAGVLHNNDIKAQKTKVGGGYHVWHFEASSSTTSNRVLSYIIYLNDVEEGGETEFLYIPKRIKPKAGTCLIFPGSFTHTHRGNPPISNEKYVLTGWITY